ncbi:MAG TPA: queuosine precursor transporter [Gammaproteobacteria bacterium]|nr:queuosine precursor transporter [Gammaproteobacteria bacterium]
MFDLLNEVVAMKKNVGTISPKHIVLLVMMYVTIDLAGTVLGYRLVATPFGVISAATLISPIKYPLADLIAEVYGFYLARKIIILGFVCEAIFALIVNAALLTPIPLHWQHAMAYQEVLHPLFRIVTSSAVGVLVSTLLNVYLLSKWKILLKGRYFWMRSLGSSAIGEAALLLISVPIGFWGVLTLSQMVSAITVGYLVRMSYTFIFVWPAAMLATLLKRAENMDVYDIGLSFNPFAKEQEEH